MNIKCLKLLTKVWRCRNLLKFKINKKINHHYKKILLEIMIFNCRKMKTVNNKKNMKINKINNHWEKSFHKIYQFASLLSHIGLHKGIPPWNIFYWLMKVNLLVFRKHVKEIISSNGKRMYKMSLIHYMTIRHGIWLNGRKE